MTNSLRDAWRFFLAHPGYSTPPGRAVCALSLARTEASARDADLTYTWTEDDDSDLSWCAQCERGLRMMRRTETPRVPELMAHAQRHTLWSCVVRGGPNGANRWPLASIGGVDFGPGRDPWMDPYRRVVEAELSIEALALLAADYADGMESAE